MLLLFFRKKQILNTVIWFLTKNGSLVEYQSILIERSIV